MVGLSAAAVERDKIATRAHMPAVIASCWPVEYPACHASFVYDKGLCNCCDCFKCCGKKG